MTVRFGENSQAVKAITTFQSVAESYIRKGHYTCPSRMTRVISWRTSLSARASYAFSIRRTRKAGTAVTSTVPIFQNYPDAESSSARTTLNGTKRIRSVQRGHSRGFGPICATSRNGVSLRDDERLKRNGKNFHKIRHGCVYVCGDTNHRLRTTS